MKPKAVVSPYMSIAKGIVVLRVWLVSIVVCGCPGTGG